VTTEEPATLPDLAGGGEEHRIAGGTIAIQASRIVTIGALVGVTTVLGRTYSLSEFGVYGLTLSFASYVLFVQGSVEAAAVREISKARTQEERDRAFGTTLIAYAGLGALAGLLIAGVGNAALGLFDMPEALRGDARLGLVALGLVTLVGWPLTVFQNVFHGTQRFRLAATVDVIAYLAYAGLMAALVVGIGAPLWIVVAVGGSIPLLTGVVALGPFLRLPERFRVRRPTLSLAYARHYAAFSGAVFLTAITDIVIYSIDRAVLAALRSTAAVGLYEGAVRPQQLIRNLQGTLVVTVLPASSRYVAAGDQPRLRELLLRGTRYVLAAMLPFTVTFMALSSEILDVWLGDRYKAAATAMTIFVGSWILGRTRAWRDRCCGQPDARAPR
jgi:O-antigen/teichoic acid export membrane protein